MTSVADSPVRSTFVTVLAWISIIFSGMGVLFSGLQNLMMTAMPVQSPFNNPAADSMLTNHFPPAEQFIFRHFQLVLFMVFIMMVITLAASIGLLRRHNWARILYITLMVLGVVYCVGGLYLQRSMFTSMQQMAASMPDPQGATGDSLGAPSPAAFGRMMVIMKVFMFLFVGAFVAVYIWIIAKLSSARIRSEFVAA